MGHVPGLRRFRRTAERSIVVNRAWSGQRVTGQQRYASEISSRLLAVPGTIGRPEHLLQNRWLAWAEVQRLSIPRTSRETLVTLTSRGPLWHPRHVVTVHDHFVLTNPEWYSPMYVRTHAPVLKAQIKGACGLIFVSEATRDRHHKLFGSRTPSVVAPNGVQKPPSVQPYHLPGGTPYLLAVASADPRKNLGALVKAYASLPPALRDGCALVLVGGGENLVFGDLDNNSHTSVPGVSRMGYVDEATLWSLYCGAKALVVPSFDEGFGLPLVEAAASGTPVVVSDLPVFRWIAGDRATYFDPQDGASIAAALAHVIKAEAGDLDIIDDVEGRFSWQSSADAVLNFVRGL